MHFPVAIMQSCLNCLLILFILNVATGKFILEYYRDCGKPSDPFKVKMVAGKVLSDNNQLVDISLVIPFPIDKNAKVEAEIETKVGKQSPRWIKVLNFKTNGICTFLNRYIGTLWFNVQRALGLTPEKCPLQAGSYHADNYTLQFKKLSLQTLPRGHIKVVFRTLLITNVPLACGEIYVMNE